MDTFRKYIIRNVQAPASAKIVATDKMIELLRVCKELVSQNSTRELIILEGPPGTGKTTSAVWLYHQLLSRKIPVVCFPCAPTPKNLEDFKEFMQQQDGSLQKLVLISNLFNMYDLTTDNIYNWQMLFGQCGRINTLIIVLSLSSAFHITFKYGKRGIKSFLVDLCIKSRIKLHYEHLDNNTMKNIFLQIRSVEPSVEELTYACGIPLVVLAGPGSIEQLVETEWTALFNCLRIDEINNKKNQKLLLALRYKLPIEMFGLDIEEANDLLPVIGNLVYIESNIPTFYINVSNDIIDGIIREISRNEYGENLDEEAVVGYTFERVASKLFASQFSIFINNKDYQLGPFTIARSRITQNSFQLGENILWQTIKSYKAVDHIAITTVAGIETVLMVQTSVQKEHHKKKVEKANLVASIPWIKDASSNPPQQIIFLYINPYNSINDYYNLKEKAIRYRQDKDIWKYAQVSLESMDRVQHFMQKH